jgi:hypothetical protein
MAARGLAFEFFLERTFGTMSQAEKNPMMAHSRNSDSGKKNGFVLLAMGAYSYN